MTTADKTTGQPPQPLPQKKIPATGSQRLAYILDTDEDTSELTQPLGSGGFAAHLFTGAEALLAACAAKAPDCLIFGDALPMDEYAPIIQEVNGARSRKIPVLIVRKDDTPENRLLAARLKTDSYFTKPLDAAKVVEEIDKRIQIRSGANPFRVLLVDDDEEQTEEHQCFLQRAGMDVQVVRHPSLVLARIADFDPDVIVAERDTPDFPAVEIAGMLRQHDAYHWIPVVILADYIDGPMRLEAIRHGSVDILPKPVSGPLLASAISSNIERARLMKSMMLSDSLTGCYNAATMRKMLASEVAQSVRDKQTCCLVMFDLDGFKRINDAYGHPVGDRVLKALAQLLRTSFRKSDLLGRFGGEEFAALLPNTPAGGATIVVNRIREEFAKLQHQAPGGAHFSTTFSAGIAERTGDMGAEELIAAAEQAVLKAKKAGKNQAQVA